MRRWCRHTSCEHASTAWNSRSEPRPPMARVFANAPTDCAKRQIYARESAGVRWPRTRPPEASGGGAATGHNPRQRRRAMAAGAKDLDCDLLVVGAGAGGLSAAVTAAWHGLKVIVAEKEPVCGGATAWSGGWMWVPLNPLSQADGII